MLVDVCLFIGGPTETALLELRQRTLMGVVDHFIVVACTRTHQFDEVDKAAVEEDFLAAGEASGAPARLVWVEPDRVMERNGRYFERPEGERGGAGSCWYQFVEAQHRNGMLAAVKTVTDDPMAVVCMSDVDELPTPQAIVRAAQLLEAEPMWIVCEQRFHSTYLDYLHPQGIWFGTCIARLEDLRPQEHRDARSQIGTPEQTVITLANAGQHYSWCGSDEERRRKLNTFSHAELRGEDPAEWRRSRVHANREQLVPISLEQSYEMEWPKPVLDGSWKIPEGWLSEDPWS